MFIFFFFFENYAQYNGRIAPAFVDNVVITNFDNNPSIAYGQGIFLSAVDEREFILII